MPKISEGTQIAVGKPFWPGFCNPSCIFGRTVSQIDFFPSVKIENATDGDV